MFPEVGNMYVSVYLTSKKLLLIYPYYIILHGVIRIQNLTYYGKIFILKIRFLGSSFENF